LIRRPCRKRIGRLKRKKGKGVPNAYSTKHKPRGGRTGCDQNLCEIKRGGGKIKLHKGRVRNEALGERRGRGGKVEGKKKGERNGEGKPFEGK